MTGSPAPFGDVAAIDDDELERRRFAQQVPSLTTPRPRKRFKCTTNSDHDQPIAPNILDRNFDAEAPNQGWVGDTTEMLTPSGAEFFLTAIIDLYSRFCVGWAVSAVNDRHLTMRALATAIRRRCPDAGLLCSIIPIRARRKRRRITVICSSSTASSAA